MEFDQRWYFSMVGVCFFVFGSCFAEKVPYNSFAKDATSASPTELYDYIIVGGGTAGCALAATLSASAKVLILERGGHPYGHPTVSKITGFYSTLADVSPTSASQPFISTDGVFNNRARILGGGSAINAGFYTRASKEFVQEAGWDPQLVDESYKWVEAKVAFKPLVQDWQAAVREGLLEAGVLPFRGMTYEHLEGTKIGGSIFDENGNRHTAADLLEYADSTKITVYLHAVVHQIMFRTLPGHKPKATGVVYMDSRGIRHTANLNNGLKNEIIISAGAIGSPQLLMLSGIGPAHHLKDHGIKVVLDQPMVGQHLSDNPMNAIVIPVLKPVTYSLIETVGISNVGSYIEASSGYFQAIFAQTMFEIYAKLANQTNVPNTTPKGLRRSNTNPSPFPTADVGVLLEKLNGPYSSGFLELQTTDPNDNPRVTFNYFQDPRDLQRCVKGMEIMKKVYESKAVSAFRYPFTSFQTLMSLMVTFPQNLRKRHLSATYSLEQYCNDTVMTLWHYHGGCQVGKVVDHDYRVIGVDSLRVIDGSTFLNDSPGTNPQATVMMLGRYMGQKILAQRAHK